MKAPKDIFWGILLGLSPLAMGSALFYLAPILVEDNPGALLSFVLLGLFVCSNLLIFILNLIFLVRKNSPTAITSLIFQVLQLILLGFVLR